MLLMKRVAFAGTENVSVMVDVKDTACSQNDVTVFRLFSFHIVRECALLAHKTGITLINSILSHC